MNRNLGIFLTAVAVSATGIIVGRALTDDDLANAASRDFTITRKGSTAKVDVLCITKVTAQDGGVAYDVIPQGKYTETMPTEDGGTETVERSGSASACSLSPTGETRAEQLFNGDGLVCLRRGLKLER